MYIYIGTYPDFMRLSTAWVVNINAIHEHDNIIIIKTFVEILFYCSTVLRFGTTLSKCATTKGGEAVYTLITREIIVSVGVHL